MKSWFKMARMAAVAFGLVLCFSGSAWGQDGPFVKLSYAYGNQSADSVNIHARVSPLGVADQVAVYVHYKQVDGTWADLRMRETMPGVNFGFRGFKASVAKPALEFVIKYVSSVGTYWDNNGGANYKITRRAVLERGYKYCNISVADKATLNMAAGGDESCSPYATLIVRNLGHNKAVGIRYTLDNWVHVDEYDADYVRAFEDPSGQIEEWVVSYPRVPRGKTMQFAIYCEDLATGAEYWDNNFGRNYRLNSTNWGAW